MAGLMHRLRWMVDRVLGRPAIPPATIIGQRVHIGHGTVIDWSHAHHITLEDDVVLSPGVRLLAHDASTRRPTGTTWVAPVRICRGAYLGSGAIVLPGVTVGEGAVVGAGSVVTRNVEAGSVVVGNPARSVGTVEELRRRRDKRADGGVPVLDERIYNAQPVAAELARELQRAAETHGGYFLGLPDDAR